MHLGRFNLIPLAALVPAAFLIACSPARTATTAPANVSAAPAAQVVPFNTPGAIGPLRITAQDSTAGIGQFPPPAGQQNVNVLVQIANSGTQNAETGAIWTLRSNATGMEYQNSGTKIVDGAFLSDRPLAAGEFMTGWLVFQTPLNAAPYTLIYRPLKPSSILRLAVP